MTQVEDKLFLGGLKHALDETFISENGIQAMLTVASVQDIKIVNTTLSTFTQNNLQKFQVVVLDQSQADLLSSFIPCINFIEKCIPHGPVLVHCYAGVSRSSTIVISYLMKKYNISAKAALSRLHQNYPSACPNHGFRKQLELFEDMNFSLDFTSQKLASYFLLQISKCLGTPHKNEYLNYLSTCSDSFNKSLIKAEYKCKKCRKLLFSNNNVLLGETNSNCFTNPESPLVNSCLDTKDIIPPFWMLEDIVKKSEFEGKIFCNKCNAKLGHFNWKGPEQDFSSGFTPTFVINISKIDENVICNK